MERYEASPWGSTPRSLTKENSHHKNYRLFFKRLPQDDVLTLDLLRTAILRESKPGTRNREFFCMAFGKLAEFVSRSGAIASEDVAMFRAELRELKRGYTPKEILPENLPTDDQIFL